MRFQSGGSLVLRITGASIYRLNDGPSLGPKLAIIKQVNRFCVLAFVLQSAVFAQGGATLVSVGYTDPAITNVAPGQDITFYLAGIKTVLPGEVDGNSVPLPLTLAGFSAQITQSGSGASFSVPLYSVRQINLCANSVSGDAACFVTALRVQIPFEIGIQPVYGLPEVGATQIVFQSPDGSSSAFAINPVHFGVHFARECQGQPSV